MVTKTKKLQDKLRLYYRGPVTRPPKIINNEEESIIIEALKEYLEKRNKVYKVKSEDGTLSVSPVFGLDKTLRCIKRQEVRAVIYDECTNEHLKGFFRQNNDILVLEGKISKNIAHVLKLSKLLILSVVEVSADKVESCQVVESEIFDKFWQIFHTPQKKDLSFKLPSVERNPSSAKSQAKKAEKKDKKRSRKKNKKEQAGKIRTDAPE